MGDRAAAATVFGAAAGAEMLDNPSGIAAGDPSGMLAAVASGGGQLRTPVGEQARAALAAARASGRPRALVVAGMGGSAAAADVLAAMVDAVPVVVHRGYDLPAWVGRDDVVAAVSCSGHTEETLSAAAEAGRRGIRLITVGATGSPLAAAGRDLGGIHLDTEAEDRPPRACLWSLAAPLLAAADALGLVEMRPATPAAAADALDALAQRCRPEVATADNPAKSLALALLGGLPMVWGFSEVAAIAATRFVAQLAENAKIPAIAGALSEPQHNQVVAFDGPLGRGASSFGGHSRLGLRLLMLRDNVEHPRLARRATETVRLAAESGLSAHQIRAQGEHPLERLASLTGLLDFTSVYLAVAMRIDPMPVGPIVTLKERLAVGATLTRPS